MSSRLTQFHFDHEDVADVPRRRFLKAIALTAGATVGSTLLGRSAWGLDEQSILATQPDWPLFRGDSQARGVAKTDLPDNLTQLWRYEVDKGAFEATPAIVDGVCYVPDLDGRLHAIGLDDGKAKWSIKTEAFSFAASPAVFNDGIYVGDIDGVFWRFNLKGEMQWKFAAGAEINSSANFYQGQVLFGSQDATLYCLDVATGKLVWKVEVNDQIRCSPTVVEDRSFVAGCDGRLHIIDLKEGKELSSVEIGSPTGVTPAALGDRVFFGTEAGELFCVDWKTSKVVWNVSSQRREVRSSPAITEKIMVIGTRGKKVLGVNPTNGDTIWTLACKRGVDSSPVIAGDRVFVASSDGTLYLLELMTGKVVWQKEMGGGFTGSPAVVDGKVVIASDDGVVYCFGSETT